MAVAVHGEPHRRIDFTNLQRAVNTAVLPRHGRSAHQPEAQARIPRLRFGLVLIILAAGVISYIAKSAVRSSLFKLIQVDVPEGPT